MPSGPEAVFVLYVDRSLDTSSTEQVILEREQSRDLEVSEGEEEKEEGRALTSLFNISLESSKVPFQWKLSNVTPILKSGDPSDFLIIIGFESTGTHCPSKSF